jgi:plastocyanin
MAAIAACGGSAATGSNRTAVAVSHVITLKDIRFHPSVLRIALGDRVTWRWEDADISTQHNVTSIGSAHFKSSSTTMTGSYTVTFPAVGTYAFECSIHPASMQGKIVVN